MNKCSSRPPSGTANGEPSFNGDLFMLADLLWTAPDDHEADSYHASNLTHSREMACNVAQNIMKMPICLLRCNEGEIVTRKNSLAVPVSSLMSTMSDYARYFPQYLTRRILHAITSCVRPIQEGRIRDSS